MIVENQATIKISTSAIIFSALIGLGFATTLASFGGAIALSFAKKLDMPTSEILVGIGVLATAMLALAYFIAGFIASRVSHQQYRFDSIIHSLGTWALMSITLMILVSSAAAGESIRRSLSGISAPVIVTDIEVFKAKATTTIESPGHKNTPKEKKKEKEVDIFLLLAWWIAFSSLLVGGATSVAGGLLGRKTNGSAKILG